MRPASLPAEDGGRSPSGYERSISQNIPLKAHTVMRRPFVPESAKKKIDPECHHAEDDFPVEDKAENLQQEEARRERIKAHTIAHSRAPERREWQNLE